MKIFRTSDGRLGPLAAAFRSRAVRILFAALFLIAIIIPAAVVAGVVWTAPGDQGAANQPASTVPSPAFNAYANTMSGNVPCPLCEIPARVYVPNSGAGTVDVIDPNTYKVISHFPVGQIPHHIAPAWDMSALYVDNEGSSSLTVINVQTGKPAGTINIPFPYNLYFTPDGTKAIDVVERNQRVEFRDWRHGWKLLGSVAIPW
ncbi:MAG TPA: YncE family protein, partial [Candidatus Dormibacteraeota bacterium]|nr:YncE family protein [Candidatus Dormibacteraeota bacterium]